MARKSGALSIEAVSDSKVLHQLGLAREIDRMVSPIRGASLSIIMTAFLFRCLISYGAASQYGGPIVVCT
jgi:hypothetical protein